MMSGWLFRPIPTSARCWRWATATPLSVAAAVGEPAANRTAVRHITRLHTQLAPILHLNLLVVLEAPDRSSWSKTPASAFVRYL
jgi:hypothetical protein